ncbi:hypothetical protein C8F04DRAFT_1188822 [Mycena alexandri]|uniref:Uncharacterized protein n=1 Tax=Mycena alexandri TaxID=1745969 RepID=A0AAD6WUZ1_9AGAR|nr:hypothetical protein C8F04DRAFT_1188822 [Mycena alexandri]
MWPREDERGSVCPSELSTSEPNKAPLSQLQRSPGFSVSTIKAVNALCAHLFRPPRSIVWYRQTDNKCCSLRLEQVHWQQHATVATLGFFTAESMDNCPSCYILPSCQLHALLTVVKIIGKAQALVYIFLRRTYRMGDSFIVVHLRRARLPPALYARPSALAGAGGSIHDVPRCDVYTRRRTAYHAYSSSAQAGEDARSVSPVIAGCIIIHAAHPRPSPPCIRTQIGSPPGTRPATSPSPPAARPPPPATRACSCRVPEIEGRVRCARVWSSLALPTYGAEMNDWSGGAKAGVNTGCDAGAGAEAEAGAGCAGAERESVARGDKHSVDEQIARADAARRGVALRSERPMGGGVYLSNSSVSTNGGSGSGMRTGRVVLRMDVDAGTSSSGPRAIALVPSYDLASGGVMTQGCLCRPTTLRLETKPEGGRRLVMGWRLLVWRRTHISNMAPQHKLKAIIYPFIYSRQS